MKALICNGPGMREWKEVPDPVLQDPEDAFVRVDAVTSGRCPKSVCSTAVSRPETSS